MSQAIHTVGVVGAGQMGNGIAQVAAAAGLSVRIHDVDHARIEAGLSAIDQRLGRLVSNERMSEDDRKATFERLSAANTIDDLADADLVIEAATENEKVKAAIFTDLCAKLNKDAILATNTSSLSITRLAAGTDRPERFVGIHFMNPVPKMKLVEVVRGIATDDATFEAVRDFVGALGKTMTLSEDFPAFIVNRILLPMINEAVATLHEGVGSVESIDTAMTLGANHPMGPLTLADFIGLDTCLSIMRVLHDGFGDPKYRPCPLLVKYVDAGWLGKKSGRGFYDYSGEKPVPTR
ncbi:3-hydroxybutyryl-CoA dehydrogenase [Pararhizobium mangrovi]|uniref:3-hydroxybutyryl-CoA dehydrogenase n=1 Tax=Pararhizobium mangrovi TaxID=2590452 RepID=A0A506TYY4_9HYPH|nr:3-hydroxybutyryl-CoA dehydrogenase [Pararhizobium mangrovi]TPW25935.1 3-hydroxybutyryl-CoA dehydrogenase [Pararhizobium mangrovi]